ncbi:MAG TPA: hypothetical protein VFL72_01675 [Acidimicrobiia bacterium]|nr:hypothetical protein [Acidimicrobiia bacterium]
MIATLVVALAACGTGTDAEIDPGDDGEYEVVLDPASFVAVVDNPLSPLVPGSTWVYESVGGEEVERIEVVVLDETRMVMGIPATVVRDTVTVDGEVVEDTYDWFAQDDAGNVWYLGEDTKEYEDGVAVSSAGSWEAGVDGALPGIVMESSPQVGDAYRQEFYPGEAEDLAEVVRVGTAETVGFGSYDDLTVIKEWNPLAPDVVEEKYYAEGVGLILEVAVRGGDDRIELVSFQPGG